ncbi:MAG TPA: hypothetical protein VK102_01535 [Sphingobacterium sp.]|nr:hypothetical protein [Sphingobacterium sp.]
MRFLCIFISILFYCNSVLYAQEAKWNEIIIEDNAQSVFEKTINFLMDRDFFIEGMDKESGFIKAKRYIKDKKVISSKYGEILSISLLLQAIEPENTKIRLQIYVKEQYKSEGFGANYKDLGLSKKETDYTALLKQLLEYTQKKL